MASDSKAQRYFSRLSVDIEEGPAALPEFAAGTPDAVGV